MEHLTKIVSKIAEDIKDMKTTMENIKTTVDTLSSQLTMVKDEQENIKESVADLFEENRLLKMQVNELEQYSKKPNIVLNGIPTQVNENLYEIMKTLGEKMKVDIKEHDIVAIHRLPSKTEISPIIVRLANYDKKSMLISVSKKIRPNTDMLGMNAAEPKPIYISEHLTKQTASLFKSAQALKKDGLVKFVWIKEGKILLRKQENSPIRKITDLKDVEQISEELRQNGQAQRSQERVDPVAANTRNKKKKNDPQSKITSYIGNKNANMN